MKQKQYKPTISSKRFYTNITFYNKPKSSLKCYTLLTKKTRKFKSIFSHKTQAGIRYIKKRPFVAVLNNIFKKFSYFAVQYLYNKLTNKEYIICKNIFQWKLVYPGLTTLYPGLKFTVYPKRYLLSKNKSYINILIKLGNIPFNLYLCYIQNYIKTKFTYSLSNGVYSVKLKAKKKYKLCLILLPSKQKIYFSKNILAILGKLDINLFKKFIFGKCGSNIKKLRKTSVRGVAKNPVDHPNGGRTKSKSPERSPWGWIAKFNC